MVLVDTSLWVEHLRRGRPDLSERLEAGEVACHPFVVGELACGELRRRGEILLLLQALPQSPLAEHEEVLRFVEQHRIFGSGIGWIDAHLLASALLEEIPLWTLDGRLAAAALRLGIGRE